MVLEGRLRIYKFRQEEILRLKQEIKELFVENTGKSAEQIEKDAQRDFFLTPNEAVNYGLIDKVLIRSDNKQLIIAFFDNEIYQDNFLKN